ncbi:MAG: TldD/PmbA family protein [Rhodospirillaceae bacterium]|jgi:PmbA protein|nr:TldD/PmbA family protein [Rhodospirillaceae bacterium]MBT6117799.1 TldD/PmbA family protein [Rhodospirillaceae bacterium]
MNRDLDLLEDLVGRAKRAGADAADAVLIEGVHIAHHHRLGVVEKLERSEHREIGLRAFVGKQVAAVSSTDEASGALDELVARAVAMARSVPEDSLAGLAEPGWLAGQAPDLDIDDNDEPSPEVLATRAGAAEDAARAVAGVTNSDGAEAEWGRWRVGIAASNGFAGAYGRTQSSISAAVLAGEGLGMERDYAASSQVHVEDLEDATEIGRRAGERAVRRLNPRRMPNARVPVIFDRRIANSLLRNLTEAINGASIARGVSFLKDKMGEAVFAPGITIRDDPHKPRGLYSKPFDGEGVGCAPRAVIKDGRLTTWLLDCRSARQLGLESTGHAMRGANTPPAPGPTNFWLEKGTVTPEAMIAEIESGLLINELIGFGINASTGDYSRGASGFWIEKGEIAYPVSEITVAGNLKDMFACLVPADDLKFRTGVDSPTVRIDGMTVAGGG